MRRQAHLRHQNAIKNAKAQVNITEPIKFAFLTNKLKTKYLAFRKLIYYLKNSKENIREKI